MPGPYFVPGGGAVPPPHFVPVLPYNSGYQPPVQPHQHLHPVPHPSSGHMIPPGTVLPPVHGSVGQQFTPGPPLHTYDSVPVQLSHTTNHNSHNIVLPTTYSPGQLAGAPLLTNSTWSTSIQGSTTYVSSSNMSVSGALSVRSPYQSSRYCQSQPMAGHVSIAPPPELLAAPSSALVTGQSLAFAPVEQGYDQLQLVYTEQAQENQVTAVPTRDAAKVSQANKETRPESQNTEQARKDLENAPQTESEGSEGQAVRADLYRTFGVMIKEHGPLEATNEKVLNIFIKLTVLERKIIMAQGSIKAFLGKCDYIRVQGNTLEVTGPVPSPSIDSPIRRSNSKESDDSGNTDSLPMVESLPSIDDKAEAMPADYMKDSLYRRFGELLRDRPLEVTSQKILNMFLKLTSSERRFIMNHGGITDFLQTCDYIKVEDSMLVLDGEIPSVPKLTSDLAPGLFLDTDTVSSTFKGFTSGSSLFPSSSFLDVSSPEFVPKSVPLPSLSKFTSPLPEFEARTATDRHNLHAVRGTGFPSGVDSKVNGQLHAEALPFTPSLSGTSSHSSPQNMYTGTVRESVDVTQGTVQDAKMLNDCMTQTYVDTSDKAEQTEPALWQQQQSSGGDRISRKKYDQALSRARSAEEQVIDLQAKLCQQTLTALRQETLENYIKIVKTPNRSESEKASLQKDYSSVMRQLQEEVDRVEILHDSNLLALTDGLELKALPDITFSNPTIPKALTSNSHTSFSSNSGPHTSGYVPVSQVDLTVKLPEDPPRDSAIEKLRKRQFSETSSIVSQDSGLDSSRKPPGLDNLQELKLKGKDPNGEVVTNSGDVGEGSGDRPRSHSSSENSAQGTLPQLPKLPGVPVMAGVPLLPGMMPGVGMSPAPGMSPEAMQHMMMMMHQNMNRMAPNPGLFLPNSIPVVPGMMPMHYMNQAQTMNNVGHPQAVCDPVTTRPEDNRTPDNDKEFFPQAHELDLEAMQVLPQTVDPVDKNVQEIKKPETGTKSADVNSNLYHWPKSNTAQAPERQQSPFRTSRSPGTPAASHTETWGMAPNPNSDHWRSSVSPEDWTDEITDGPNDQVAQTPPMLSPNHPSLRGPPRAVQDDAQARGVPGHQAGLGQLPLKEQMARWMPQDVDRSSVSPPVTASLPSPGPGIPVTVKKPLPVLQSSIPTVAVNVVQPGPPRGYSIAEPVKPEHVAPDSTTSAEEGPSDANIQEKNREVDSTNPVLARRPVTTQLPHDGSVSGISEIRMQDDVGVWETGWENIPDTEPVEWKHVSKKKLKAEEVAQSQPTATPTATPAATPTATATSNFERLLQKIKDTYPKLSRQDVIKVVNEVRENRGGLKGVSMAQILEDTANIIRNSKAVKPPVPAPEPLPDQGPNVLFKTSICTYWQQGKCTKKSKDCIFAHGKKDLRALPRNTMCNNIVTKGTCPYGDKCIYAHTKEQMKKGH